LDTEERYVADLHSVLIGYRFVISFLVSLFKRARAFIAQVLKNNAFKAFFRVHPQNVQLLDVQLQNVQLQNVHLPDVQLQNQTSLLPNVQITKRPVTELKKAEEREEESKPNPPKKPGLDLTKNRPAWCMGSVAEAVRSDGPASGSSWAGRGRAAPRGGLSSDRAGGRGRGAYGNGKGRGHSEPYRGRSEAPRGHWVPRGGRPYRGRGRGKPF
jgi:hypothetical protein